MAKVDHSIMCTSCGTSIRGEEITGACAVCGTSIEETLRRVGVDPALMNVAEDVVCLRCGYNLRTIPIGGVCPECGEAVATSLRVDDLRNANPDWLRRVRSGMTLLILTPLIAIGVGILFQLMSYAVGPSAANSSVASGINAGIDLVLWLVGCIGVFKATASDPSLAAREYSNRYRNIARICAFMPPIMLLVLTWATYSMPAAASPPFTSNLTYQIKVILTSSAIFIFTLGLCAICLFICIRRLFHRARRIGLRKLATVQICFVGVGMLLVAVAMIIIGLVFIPFMSSPGMAIPTTASAPSTSTGTVVQNPGRSVTVEEYESDNQNPATSPAGATTISPTAIPATLPASMPSGAMPVLPRMSVFVMMGIANCGAVLVMFVSTVLGLIILFKVRGLLTTLVVKF
jgi:hypothetical protein